MGEDLKEKIKQIARGLGIDLIGFTSAAPFNELEKIFLERKAQGYLSGFEEQDIAKRIDPRLTLENAETIIVIGMSYYTDASEICEEEGAARGTIARSAWGKDYHEVLRNKLLILMKKIEELIGFFQYRIFVDTGPLSDRAVARRAGLGWIGKNNMLITRQYGSWVFIGYGIVDFKIEQDEPLQDSCAGCNACIQACPAGALEEGYKLKGKKCLSFITQTKDEIESEECKKLGNRIYGCDTCQLVCPHNQKIKKTKTWEFLPDPSISRPKLVDLLSMDNQTFKEKYENTAAGWRGKNTLRRNAIIALANSRDPKGIPYLEKLLAEDSKMIRKYALRGIVSLEPQAAKNILKTHLKRERDAELKGFIENFLGDDCN
ncbi:epoxyqueuosine reductase [Geosporobacter subterraneus DSM 17957]|uniref:Epoxyqueuosine reductase n=1 Tax=Geosporobacter subterraneus DSM 17957 TaxID=1121919 RepID=A0A1M6G746_9FIRM|nr:tRNA epoxyqueuosine(34) reductase QueG [Geosporobacter subterraneus]SHJ05786.1 epoxyqueuosine reductase [Geosporobacter subterraneus DSM 17957]